MKVTSDWNLPSIFIPVTTKGRGITWTPDLKLLLDRRLEKITERFPQKIRSIAASLEDVNGPRGGNDKRCRINLMLESRGHLSVSARAPKTESAITRASERARSVLLRKLQGTRSRRSEYRAIHDGLGANVVHEDAKSILDP